MKFPKFIYHITTDSLFRFKKKLFYKPKNFETEGFIHFSFFHQLIETANRIFSSEKHLIVFVLPLPI